MLHKVIWLTQGHAPCKVAEKEFELRSVWTQSLMSFWLPHAKASPLLLCTSPSAPQPFHFLILTKTVSSVTWGKPCGPRKHEQKKTQAWRGGCVKRRKPGLSLPEKGIKPLPSCRWKWSVIGMGSLSFPLGPLFIQQKRLKMLQIKEFP